MRGLAVDPSHGYARDRFVTGTVVRSSGSGSDSRPKHGYVSAMAESENESEATQEREAVSGSANDHLHTAPSASASGHALGETVGSVNVNGTASTAERAERRAVNVSVSVPKSANDHGH
jgi:hypothetical protein